MNQAAAIVQLREWAEEIDASNSGPLTDTNALTYLQGGAEALNRRIGYFYVDLVLSGGSALVAGTQEYAWPTDALEIVWLEVGTKFLQPIGYEEIWEKQPGYRQEAANLPIELYLYGNKFGLYPKPDAEAAALTSTLRYIGTPTISSATGFDNLAAQDHRVAIMFAVSDWFMAHGRDSDFARANAWLQRAEKEAQVIAEQYALRRTRR